MHATRKACRYRQISTIRIDNSLGYEAVISFPIEVVFMIYHWSCDRNVTTVDSANYVREIRFFFETFDFFLSQQLSCLEI